MTGSEQPKPKKGLMDLIREKLESLDIDLESILDGDICDTDGVKVVFAAPHLRHSVEAMGKSARDHTLMVRVDEETSRTLDLWVESGAVKSRSEAAALFIREGLRMRASELSQLRSALDEVEAAKSRLRDKAKEVFGDEEG